MGKRLISLTFCFILLLPVLFSQQLIFEKSRNITKKIFKELGNSEQEQIADFFLSSLPSESNVINKEGSELSWAETLKLYRENNRYFVSCRWSYFTFRDVRNYKGFDITEVFLPGQVSSEFNIVDRSLRKLVGLKIDTCCVDSILSFFEYRTYLPLSDSAAISTASDFNWIKSDLFFTQHNIDNFSKQLSLIEEYYETAPKLDELRLAINRIETQNIDMMPLYQIDMNKLMRDLRMIENSSFFQQLNLQRNDPLQLAEKLRVLKQEMIMKNTVVGHLMESIDDIYYNKAYNNFLKNQYDIALDYFERTVRVNQKHLNAYYKMGEIYFIQGEIDKAASLIIHLVQRVIAPEEIDANLISLVQQVQMELLERGERLVREEQFHDALTAYSKADTFCLSIPFIVCDPRIAMGKAKAKYGLYNSYLIIAEKAIETEKLELAVRFIGDAARFQRENSGEIISNLEADQIMQLVIDKLISKGRSYCAEDEYDKAVGLLDKAYELCETNPAMLCSETLRDEMRIAQTGLYRNVLVLLQKCIDDENIVEAERLLEEADKFEQTNPVSLNARMETENMKMKINRFKYGALISEGEQLLFTGKNEEALVAFLKAKSMEANDIAFRNPMLDDYIRQIAKPMVDEIISQGIIKAWGNDIIAANQLLVSVDEALELYMLKNDTTLSLRRMELNNRIKERDCNNYSFELDKNFRSAQRLSNNREYVAAYEILYPTYMESLNKPQCEIEVNEAKLFLEQIYPLYNYSKLQRDAYNALSDLQFLKLDSILNELNVMFNSIGEIHSQSSPVTLESVLNQNSNCNVLLEAARYYASSNPDNALTVLRKASRANCLEPEFKVLSADIAAQLAVRDYEHDKTQSSASLIQQYVGQSPWFNEFRTAFLKTWRKKKWKI
ncbi:MAG: hypothetical protein PHT69_13730 [Bacteroidales bacterium]|nr:hypothetical protein [Bacteroidales bacterium]